ncbi:MAG: hypothetical protein RKP20_15970 [Candidatus Competibacter sp.]|nr:hypothetical protein [Candidatus Competibacter sp.]
MGAVDKLEALDRLIGALPEPPRRAIFYCGDGRTTEYPTEFIDDRPRNRCGDVIWRVRWGQGWLYIYILLAFQSGVHGRYVIDL